MDSCDNQEKLRLCAKGCGFYGSPATRNLCSKCFRDELKKEAAKPCNNQALDNNPKTNPFPWVGKKTSIVETTTSAVKASRCKSCKKKVGVMGFSCRCGGIFCATHRYPEEHACGFDFKASGRDAITKQNPVCKADKLDQRIQ